jgi:hypothetical protein
VRRTSINDQARKEIDHSKEDVSATAVRRLRQGGTAPRGVGLAAGLNPADGEETRARTCDSASAGTTHCTTCF